MMDFFKKIEFKRTHLIIHFQLLISLIFFVSFSIAIFAISTIFTNYNYWIYLIILNVFLSIFGNATYLIFTKKQLFLIEAFFAIPKLRIKETNSSIKVLEKYPEEQNDNIINIYLGNDPWEEMGFSDWVEIKYQNKEYAIGGNKNFKKLFVEIKLSLAAMNIL